MYEAPASPKKEIPYPWILAGITILSCGLLIVAVVYRSTAIEKDKALASSRAEAVSQGLLLQARIDLLTKEVAALRAKNGVEVSNIAQVADNSRDKLRDSMSRKVAPAAAVPSEHPALRKSRLYDEAWTAKGKNDVEVAQGLYRQIIVGYPGERDACVELSKLLASNVGGVTWAEKNQCYLARLDEETWIKKSSTGLRYKIVAQGNAFKPGASSVVRCHYEGRLFDGIIFDSTKNRNDVPAEFSLKDVIPAWTEGVQHIGVGGRILLYCPPSIAYGKAGVGTIPGDSVLIFEVELVDITK